MIKIKNNLKYIEAKDLQKLIKEKNIIIIDIREQFEIDITSVPNTINIPLQVVLNNYSDILNKDQQYYILCHTGQRSLYLTVFLSEKGYNAVNVNDGIALMNEFYIHY